MKTAAQEAGARALCEYGVLTVDGEVATWERHEAKLRQMAQVVLNAADHRHQDRCEFCGQFQRRDGTGHEDCLREYDRRTAGL